MTKFAEYHRQADIEIATLTQAQLDQYARDGLIYPLDALTRVQAHQYLEQFYSLRRRMGNWLPIKQIQKSYLVESWVDELIRHPAIADAVGSILGPDIYTWGATFFYKSPDSGGYVGWHQDLRYWGLTPGDDVLTVWLALSDAKVDNGCMAVIPGTHHDTMREHVNLAETRNLRQSGQEISLSEEELKRKIDAELEPGQFSIHHSHAVHGSNPNHSVRCRLGLSINFISSQVSQTLGKDSVMRVRSKPHPNFIEEPRPTGSFQAAGIDNFRRFIRYPSGYNVKDTDWENISRNIC